MWQSISFLTKPSLGAQTPNFLSKFFFQKSQHFSQKSQYTVNSTKEFIDMIKKERVPSSYKMISDDVSSLFTMVLLDYLIDLILKRIYGNKEIQTKISRKDMKSLLSLCTKNVHFTFGNNTYQQRDGITMRSPLEISSSVLAGIFMVHICQN